MPVPTFLGVSTQKAGEEGYDHNEANKDAIAFQKSLTGAASAETGIDVDSGAHSAVDQQRGSLAGAGPHTSSHLSTMHELALS